MIARLSRARTSSRRNPLSRAVARADAASGRALVSSPCSANPSASVRVADASMVASPVRCAAAATASAIAREPVKSHRSDAYPVVAAHRSAATASWPAATAWRAIATTAPCSASNQGSGSPATLAATRSSAAQRRVVVNSDGDAAVSRACAPRTATTTRLSHPTAARSTAPTRSAAPGRSAPWWRAYARTRSWKRYRTWPASSVRAISSRYASTSVSTTRRAASTGTSSTADAAQAAKSGASSTPSSRKAHRVSGGNAW